MQCLLALGFVARRVGISKADTEWMVDDKGSVGHSIMEVWPHLYHKWVVLDADLNVHCEQDGVPLNALEIHRAWVNRKWADVRLIQGPTAFRLTDNPSSGFGVVRSEDAHHAALWTFSRHRVGDYYARVYIPMRNTYRSSEEPTQRIHWTDEWTPPNAINRNRPHRGPWTANEHDLYWTVDQVQIHLQADEDAWAKGEAALYVRLEHSMPNLKALMVRFDGGEWEESKPERIWRLRPGKNGIMAKGINAFDREGHVSRILLRYHP